MIKIKENAQQAQELSEQLRLGTGEFTAQRHGIVGLSLIAIGSISLNSQRTFLGDKPKIVGYFV